MSRIVAILMAVGAIVFLIRYFRNDQRLRQLEHMTPDELLNAVLRHDITLADVPMRHRQAVGREFDKIQFEMNMQAKGAE